MKRLTSGLIAVAACLTALQAHADTRSFRCQRDLVKLGDSKASALTKCGEPVMKDAFCKKADPQTITSPSGSSTTVVGGACETVDEWTYNPGRGQFMTTLRFESGVLTAIQYGDRVK